MTDGENRTLTAPQVWERGEDDTLKSNLVCLYGVARDE